MGLFTSVVEGFLLGVGEMLASGVPVVSTPVHYGAKDQITDGFNGFVAKSFEPSEIAKSMNDILSIETKREAISSDYLRRFSQESVSEKWINLLRSSADY